MNMPTYDPSLIVDPYNWVIAAFALFLMCLRAYIPFGWQGRLIPLWWRICLRFFSPVMRKLDRLGRGAADLGFRAVVLVVVAVLLSALVGRGIEAVDHMIADQSPLPRLASLAGLMTTLYAGSIWRVMRRASDAGDEALLRSAELQRLNATYSLAPLQDAPTARRLMIAHAALALDRMALLPIIWFLIFGVTGALVAASLAALVWQEKLSPPRSAFGETLLAIEKLTGFIPNWLTGVFLSLATLVAPRAGVMRTMTGLNPEQPRVAYESGGFAVAAMAWGLRITLGGPLTARDGTVLNWRWVGPDGSSARVDNMQVKLALYWVIVTALMIMAALLSAAMWSRVL